MRPQISPDVSVVVTFSDEEGLAIASLDSMKDTVDVARAAGVTVEARAILDSANRRTSDLVRRRGQWLNSIDEVAFRDLGLTRNAAAQIAKGRFLAFLDGDDLWGKRWIADAHSYAIASEMQAVWHPEYLYYFDDDGFNQHSVTATPNRHCRAHYGVHVASNAPEFDPRSLIFANAWSANALTTRQVHLIYPYDETDAGRGIGFEDWGWNIKTLRQGVPHLIVKSTVHAIRRKKGSLSMRMKTFGALPIY